MKDPKRLSDFESLPNELQGALRALGRDAPSAQAVARIQRSLSTLQSPPAPVSPTRGASLSWNAGAYAVATAVVACGIAAWLGVPRAEPRAPVAKVQPAHEVSEPPPTAAEPAPADTIIPITENIAPRPSHHEDVGARRPHGSVQRTKPEPHTSEPVGATAHAPREAAAPAITAVDTRAELVKLEPARTQQLPAPEDEASLLYRAKHAAREHPKTALHMLDQHVAHFPRGALVEEREVLAIALLRRMGREAEAKQRAATFLARFPRSSYRSAVEP